MSNAKIAPRHFLIVSGTEDNDAADAQDIVDLALSAFGAPGEARTQSHIRIAGGHALEAQRHEAIVNWVVQAVAEAK